MGDFDTSGQKQGDFTRMMRGSISALPESIQHSLNRDESIQKSFLTDVDVAQQASKEKKPIITYDDLRTVAASPRLLEELEASKKTFLMEMRGRFTPTRHGGLSGSTDVREVFSLLDLQWNGSPSGRSTNKHKMRGRSRGSMGSRENTSRDGSGIRPSISFLRSELQAGRGSAGQSGVVVSGGPMLTSRRRYDLLSERVESIPQSLQDEYYYPPDASLSKKAQLVKSASQKTLLDDGLTLLVRRENSRQGKRMHQIHEHQKKLGRLDRKAKQMLQKRDKLLKQQAKGSAALQKKRAHKKQQKNAKQFNATFSMKTAVGRLKNAEQLLMRKKAAEAQALAEENEKKAAQNSLGIIRSSSEQSFFERVAETIPEFTSIKQYMHDMQQMAWRNKYMRERVDDGKGMTEELKARQRVWKERSRAGMSAAEWSVKTKLMKYREDPDEKDKLLGHVAVLLAERRHPDHGQAIERNIVEIHESTTEAKLAKARHLTQKVEERTKSCERMRRARAKERNKQADHIALERHSRTKLAELDPKSRKRRVRFQRVWLAVMQAVPRTNALKEALKQLMKEKIRQRTQLFAEQYAIKMFSETVSKEAKKSRSKTMTLIFARAASWLNKVRKRLQRRRMLELRKFFIMAKNMHLMRVHLKRDSFRAKIRLLQRWWRIKMGSATDPLPLIELKWLKIEKKLIRKSQKNRGKIGLSTTLSLTSMAKRVRKKSQMESNPRRNPRRESMLSSSLSAPRGARGSRRPSGLTSTLTSAPDRPRRGGGGQLVALQEESDLLAQSINQITHPVPHQYRVRYIRVYLNEVQAKEKQQVKAWTVRAKKFKVKYGRKLRELELQERLGMDVDYSFLNNNLPVRPQKRIFFIPDEPTMRDMISRAFQEWQLVQARIKIETFVDKDDENE
jgi:hypothetical protein